MIRFLVIQLSINLLIARMVSNSSDYDREFKVLCHDTNQVKMCISNYGMFGQDETWYNPGCWWPKWTYHSYMHGAGLWFGTIDPLTGDTLVTTGHDTHTGTSECAPGIEGMPVNHPCAIIYMYPDNWPPPESIFPMAPQVAVSHQDSWCAFNDCDSRYHNPGDTRPIGIEVYQTVYVWDISEIEDMVFLVYDIKNVSGSALHDCYVGIEVHCAIGYSDPNDQCCAIVDRTYLINGDTIEVDNIGYQWQDVEEWGMPPWFPGTIGFDLLQTPFDLVAGMDKDGDGILDQYERDSAYYVSNLPQYLWDVDSDGMPDWRDPSQWPQFGMTAFKRFIFPNPGTDEERFLSMAGYNFMTGQYEPYDTIFSNPDDWWIIVESSGPFDLAPDSIVTLVFSVIFANWHGLFLEPDTALALADKWAEDYYNMYWYLYTGINENYELRKSNCELNIVPNPIACNGNIEFALPQAEPITLKLYNSLGQVVETLYDGLKPAGVHEFHLDARQLPQGTYFLVLETPSLKTSESFVVLR